MEISREKEVKRKREKDIGIKCGSKSRELTMEVGTRHDHRIMALGLYSMSLKMALFLREDSLTPKVNFMKARSSSREYRPSQPSNEREKESVIRLLTLTSFRIPIAFMRFLSSSFFFHFFSISR